MSKYFEIIIDGVFKMNFNNSKEAEATEYYHQTVEENPGKSVKLILHRRKQILNNNLITKE